MGQVRQTGLNVLHLVIKINKLFKNYKTVKTNRKQLFFIINAESHI